jgi:hypothetical protein
MGRQLLDCEPSTSKFIHVPSRTPQNIISLTDDCHRGPAHGRVRPAGDCATTGRMRKGSQRKRAREKKMNRSPPVGRNMTNLSNGRARLDRCPLASRRRQSTSTTDPPQITERTLHSPCSLWPFAFWPLLLDDWIVGAFDCCCWLERALV